ncbi:pyridine nucleotide-disulfide oxidoreductase, class I [Burkholderia lata]|uniref:Pyridine nucleotide-disulfide oxidoreductase, class I n=1 Tax=Burkholderia lata (strain ATCC 17760 / DSM 23089 / LMG 22485 / NCIMB 9086 / R18194 / 383) TaxID=482957 RepID=A0A6P2UR45_BURL3|nr:FAD-dependent oxidoreductase [Burkholderia lata]VWC76425.1 pyridine nucleotide-disulfide oxidoreductase, class I [Burkholderia lata]
MNIDPSNSRGIVIVGAGHAGTEAAFALRSEGLNCPITLINGEDAFPYQRPPLSKSFLLSGTSASLRSEQAFANADIELVRASVEKIERDRRILRLGDGRELQYDHLVLAVGAKPHRLTMAESLWKGNLNDLQSTERVRSALPEAQRIAIIGAGFIGLEFAAVATSLGKEVVVVDRAPRVLERAASPDISRYIEEQHRSRGTRIVLDVGLADLQHYGSTGSILTLSSGEQIEADLVVEAIGVAPRLDLARQADLSTDIGIVVDHDLLTSDPHISAIGDCAQFPMRGAARNIVLTSVQNAGDHAKHAAKRLAGTRAPYSVVPWFWSDQGDDKLQIAGLVPRDANLVVRRTKNERSFSIFSFVDGRLASVETINAPADHIAARRILGEGISISPEQAGNIDFKLNSLLEKRIV